MEQSPHPVIITDLNCYIEYVNDAFIKNTGYSREDVLGKNPNILKSGKTPVSTYEEMWKTLLSGETWRGEFINHTRNGEVQIESAIIVPLRQPNGSITHYVAMKENITAKKSQEELIIKLYTAVDQSPSSIVITNKNACIEYVNQAFVKATGYSFDEAVGNNPRVLKSGHTPKETYDEMWAALTRGVPWQGELVNRRKDGSEYYEFAIIAPVRQQNGKITHYLAIKEDITEKKRLSIELDHYRVELEQLVEQRTAEVVAVNAELQAVLDGASTGIVLVKGRIIIRCSRRIDEIFGYEHGELLGQSTRIWFANDDDWTRVGSEIEKTVPGGGTCVNELEFVRKDGSRFWARLSIRAFDPSNPRTGTVGIFEDITRASPDQVA